MKKVLLTLALPLWALSLVAQQTGNGSNTVDTSANSNKQFVRTAANLKSGTSQDVLTSFFKLGFADISNNHHFQFNSSLLAVKAKTDSLLWVDTNYRREVFARNFVFGIDVGLDSSYKFQSAAVNFKYAIINDRDRSVFTTAFGKTLYDFMDNSSRVAAQAEQIYFGQNRDKVKSEGKLIGNFFFFSNKKDQTPVSKLPARFRVILDSVLSANKMVTSDKFANFRDSIGSMTKVAAGLLAQTALWTVGGQVTANQQQLFNRGNLNSEFLKGITKNNTSMGLELDIKANLNVYDTTATSQNTHRSVFSSSAGINWIIYKDKITQKSYIEFKPSLTYNNVFAGQLTGETKSKFTGDGVLRFRVTDSIWIPIDIMYNPQSGKVFGFLNITTNFDALGAIKTSANSQSN